MAPAVGGSTRTRAISWPRLDVWLWSCIMYCTDAALFFGPCCHVTHLAYLRGAVQHQGGDSSDTSCTRYYLSPACSAPLTSPSQLVFIVIAAVKKSKKKSKSPCCGQDYARLILAMLIICSDVIWPPHLFKPHKRDPVRSGHKFACECVVTTPTHAQAHSSGLW